MNEGTTIWFTGLSGSGKTTIAERLKKELEQENKTVTILDGDVVRNTLHKNLGFSREDIKENNRLIAQLAKEKKDKFDFILVPIISPYREDRAMAKTIIGSNFIELFINTSLEECARRDVKGLYLKALTGEIPNFIGVAKSNPYEKPSAPEIKVDTKAMNLEESIKKIIQDLKLD